MPEADKDRKPPPIKQVEAAWRLVRNAGERTVPDRSRDLRSLASYIRRL